VVRKRIETPTANQIINQVIPVELTGWVTRFIGGNGAGRRVFEEPLAEPGTVRSVLHGLTDRYPELAGALWHGNDLGEHIEVLVNDAVLGIDHTIDSRLRPGDRIALIGQYLGG
jgi:hypothetical protein